MTKADQIREALQRHPKANPGLLAKRFNVNPSHVYTLRKALWPHLNNGSQQIAADEAPAAKADEGLNAVGKIMAAKRFVQAVGGIAESQQALSGYTQIVE